MCHMSISELLDKSAERGLSNRFDLLVLSFEQLRAAYFATSEAEACGAIVERIIAHEQAKLAKVETQMADIKAAKVRSLSDLDAAA